MMSETQKTFTNKIALVTGARGIAEGVIRRLVADGAQVMITSPSESCIHLAEELGPAAAAHRCDIRTEDAIKSLIAVTVEKFGRLDLLCNNAGIAQRQGPLHEWDIDRWFDIIDLNLRSAFLMLKYSIPHMLERPEGGAIVNMASIGAFQPSLGTSAYPVSKAGMISLTKLAALEYAKDNIRINAVCPGTIITPLVESRGDALRATKEKLTPMGKLGTIEDVASITAYLLSDEARYITGAAYTIAGGREAM